MRGGKQPETKFQSVGDERDSAMTTGEPASDWRSLEPDEGRSAAVRGSVFKPAVEVVRVVGDGMEQKAVQLNWGDLSREESGSGVRASIVVMKRRNGRGAKGGRKVDVVTSLQREGHRR